MAFATVLSRVSEPGRFWFFNARVGKVGFQARGLGPCTAPLRSGGSTVIDHIVYEKLGQPVGVILAGLRVSHDLAGDDFRHRVVHIAFERKQAKHR
jgi:hypothetical protein